MQGVPEQFEHPQDRAEFRRAQGRQGVELYRAHIVRHAFDPHTHDAYGVGAIEQGVERFRYKGSDHLAPPDSIVLMNPDVLHTGQAETEGGWRYRMIYIEPEVFSDITGESGWWFPGAVVDQDPGRAKRLSKLLGQLWQTQDSLAFDSLLFQLVAEIRPHARVQNANHDKALHNFSRVIEYMQAHLEDRVVLDDLATIAGLSPFHFLRKFQAQHHVTPQQMLMARRLFAAKQLLAAGMPPAQVAAACGLTDQSHLNRTFVRRYGVTPARYQQQVCG